MEHEQFKERCNMLNKHIWMPEINKLSDLIQKKVEWDKRSELEEDYIYLLIKKNDHIPEEERTIKSLKSYAVIVKPEYRKWFNDRKLDERDSVTLELIDWGDNQGLLIQNNSLIISSNWLNLILLDGVSE